MELSDKMDDNDVFIGMIAIFIVVVALIMGDIIQL